jgi:serine/threonine protein kinase
MPDDHVLDAEPKSKLDEYEVTFNKESKLGFGGFGEVYRGKQKSTGKFCAIKKFNTPSIASSPNDLLAFQRHISILSSLSSKFVIKMMDSFEDE